MNPAFYLCLCVLCTFGVVFGDYDWSSNPGDGTEGNPYQISTAEQLALIGPDAALLDKHFILTADIDMSAYTFDNSPIAPDTDQTNDTYAGENRFSGTLDGKGHVIRDLTISRSGTSYNIGLVGLTTSSISSWEIKNLGVDNLTINVADSSKYLGGLVGRGYGGAVSSCYTSGSITSGDSCSRMGGLAGLASATHISNCYAVCSVTNGTASTLTGGAVGQYAASTGKLEKCYSTGTVSSGGTATSIGALVGALYTGAQVVDCYFLDTAGPDNGIGTAKTIALLKLRPTYTNWKFNGVILGNQGYWRMRDDQYDYPYLEWEFVDGDFHGDFQVDMLDLAEFSQCWLTDPDSFDFNYLCDLNKDGFINLDDFNIFCRNWLKIIEFRRNFAILKGS
ncbi:MAG: dockerin type I domain-containing protein [Planctomycetota bacterium]